MDINTLMPFLGGMASGFIITALFATLSKRGGQTGPEGPDAVQLLGVLQERGRFVDFLMDPAIKEASDEQIGAFARTMHEGCRKVIDEYFPLDPAIDAAEETEYRVEEGFDPSTVKLTGNVGSKPPFTGTVRHSGWRVKEVRLPARPSMVNEKVVTPAEIEVR